LGRHRPPRTVERSDCLDANPSLKPRRQDLFTVACRQARKLAVAETGSPPRTFPVDPPFTLDELASEDTTPWQAPQA